MEIERLSLHELIFISVLTICKEEKQFAPPAVVRKNGRYHQTIFSPQRRYEDISGFSLMVVILKENFSTSRFYWHRSESRKKKKNGKNGKKRKKIFLKADGKNNCGRPPGYVGGPVVPATSPNVFVVGTCNRE